MEGLELAVTIVDERLQEKCVELFRLHHVTALYSTLGNGTAKNEMLEFLGLENTKRSIHLAVMTIETRKAFVKDFMRQVHYGQKGNGIFYTTPFSSIGGLTLMEYMVKEQERAEVNTNEVILFECIIAITSLGFNEMVMKAARKEGATGGTVLHVKGENTLEEEKFFGITLSEEKEIVMIVVRKEKKNPVMKAIMSEAGMSTPARTVVFSIPVSSVAGIQNLEQE